jgi:hypothetical protein
VILFVFATGLRGQYSGIDRLIEGELRMTFPSIYFKNNSTDYASMPYTVDSCFKYIAANIKNLNSYVIWRDSAETDQLTESRIKRVKTDLNKYTSSDKIHFHNMREAQKISRRTVDESVDDKQGQYLLSLNSVLDVSGTVSLSKKKSIFRRRTHLEGRYLCFGCWRRGAFSKEYQRLHGRKKKPQNK